jgi:anaerobic C4-dicarboxylate transporter
MSEKETDKVEHKSTVGENRRHMSLQRQTYLVMGILLIGGIILGTFASSWWLLLPFAVSIGILSAGILGTCNMTRLLSFLPGNPTHSGDIS